MCQVVPFPFDAWLMEEEQMSSKVYAMDLRASMKENLYVKLDRLLDGAGIEEAIKERHLVAIKLHFGEKGNTAYIPPIHLRHLVNRTSVRCNEYCRR